MRPVVACARPGARCRALPPPLPHVPPPPPQTPLFPHTQTAPYPADAVKQELTFAAYSMGYPCGGKSRKRSGDEPASQPRPAKAPATTTFYGGGAGDGPEGDGGDEGEEWGDGAW